MFSEAVPAQPRPPSVLLTSTPLICTWFCLTEHRISVFLDDSM